MTWTTLHMEVTTPLFNGGHSRDRKEGVRVASLRGAMRFWFRALAGTVTGPNLRTLAALEERVFGGPNAASPVSLRIPHQPPVRSPAAPNAFLIPATQPIDKRRKHGSRWIVYLLGQDLGDLAEVTIQRPYVAPGESFDLKLRFSHRDDDTIEIREAIESLVLASLWLTCTFGGVGARTRRGFGGLRILGVDNLSEVMPWDATSIRTPELDYYDSLTCLWPAFQAEMCLDQLRLLAQATEHTELGDFDAWDWPTYPVLSPRHTRASVTQRSVPGWDKVLIRAGEEWRYFRASKDYPGVNYSPPIKTPEWVDVITGANDHFGLGALGLPVGYRDRVVHAGCAGEKPLRRASPLWLRPVGSKTGWKLLSFAFLGEFLPRSDALGVYLWQGKRQGRRLSVVDDDVRIRAEAWIQAMQRGESFIRQVRT